MAGIPDVQLTPAQVEEIVDRKLRGSNLSVLVRQLQGGMGTSGTDTVTFTASVDSATKTVTHGLRRTPTQVLVTAGSPGTGWTTFFVQNITATTFDVQGHDVDGVARTGAGTFHWLAR